MTHFVNAVTWIGTDRVNWCSCGRSGDFTTMSEHIDAMRWRSFVDAAMNGEVVTIMGRQIDLGLFRD